MSTKTRTILFTALATLLAVVVIQNFRTVSLRLIVFEIQPYLAVLLAVFFGLGYGVAWFMKRR